MVGSLHALSLVLALIASKVDKPVDEAAVATLIKALSDANSETRAAAAGELRQIVTKFPSGTVNLSSKDGGEAAWREKVKQVELGMTRKEVRNFLPSFAKESAEGGLSDGGNDYVFYRLDYHWTVSMVYCNRGENNGKLSRLPELKKNALRIHVAPPKDFTGTWVTWHVNGQKAYEIQYKNGKYDGVFTSFHDNGTKSTEQHYASQGAHGPGKGWFPNGKVSYTIEYRGGKQDGKWTHWHSNGNKHSETHYSDGKYHGRTTYWHENGRISSVNDYFDDVKHGLEASWDENGNWHYERILSNGEIVKILK